MSPSCMQAALILGAASLIVFIVQRKEFGYYLRVPTSLSSAATTVTATNSSLASAPTWPSSSASVPSSPPTITAAAAGEVDDLDPAGAEDGVMIKEEEEDHPALAQLRSIEAAYAERGMGNVFALRGKGWLYRNHNLALTLIVRGDATTDGRRDVDDDDDAPATVARGSNVIEIYNVLEDGGGGRSPACDPSRVTIWVRVLGEEIVAGLATPSSRQCRWTFEFDLDEPGEYAIEAKLLSYHGLAPFDNAECRARSAAAPVEEWAAEFPHNLSIDGFKFYDSALTCCEACTRFEGCRRWSVPSARPHHSCDLYFADEALASRHRPAEGYGPQRRERRRRDLRGIVVDEQIAWGTPRLDRNGTSYYLGCGWQPFLSLDYPCLTAREDMVHGTPRKIRLPPPPVPPATTESPRGNSTTEDSRPLCGADDEDLRRDGHRYGRWVRIAGRNRENGTDPVLCPEKFEVDRESSKGHLIHRHYGSHPLCWHRDTLARMTATCVEPGCRFVVDDMWRSLLYEEGQGRMLWARWEPHACRYRELTDRQVQRCVSGRKIESIDTKGASIAVMLGEYLAQRLKGVRFVPPGNDTVRVQLTTLGMPHVAWHKTFEEFRTSLEDGEAFKTGEFVRGTEREVKFFVSGFLASSEREVHVTAERMLALSEIAEEELKRKNNTILNAFDLTAAFTYDTAWQFDGLHVTGSPAKMVVVKLLHHLCASHVPLEPNEGNNTLN